MDDRALMHVTVTLLTAGLTLVALGAAGVGGSVPLAGVGVVVTGGLYLLADRLPAGRLGPVDAYGDRRILWVSPGLATLVVVGWLNATPGELQTLGGVVGLVGMANYFLRPVYHLVADLVTWVAGDRN